MAAPVVYFDLTVVDITTGLWCPHCLLSSGVEALAVMSWAKDPTTICGRFTYRVCNDCGSPL
jgi:hypothetical protein